MRRLLLPFGHVLPLFSLLFLLGVCAADAPPPSMVVIGSGPSAMLVGDSNNTSFDAVVNNAPSTNQECTITGPKWSWSVSVSGGPHNNGSGASASLDSPTNPDEEDDSATLTLSFSEAGTYRIAVSANAHYTSSCKDGDVDVGNAANLDVIANDFSVTITQSKATPNPAVVGEKMEMRLDAILNVPAGASVTYSPSWEWDFGTIQYRKTDAEPWDKAPGFSATLAQSPPGASKAIYWCTFSVVGQYRIQIKAKATFKANGSTKDLTRPGEAYIE